MKKRSLYLVMFLMLFVIIGGVFATWKYNEEITNVEDTGTTVEVADYESTGGKITAENTVKITVDQKADGDYTAILVGTGSLILTYAPAEGNGETAGPAGTTTINVAVTDPAGSEISIKTESLNVTWDSTNTATIEGQTIADALQINKVLGTYTEYKDYRDNFGTVIITLTISVA